MTIVLTVAVILAGLLICAGAILSTIAYMGFYYDLKLRRQGTDLVGEMERLNLSTDPSGEAQ